MELASDGKVCDAMNFGQVEGEILESGAVDYSELLKRIQDLEEENFLLKAHVHRCENDISILRSHAAKERHIHSEIIDSTSTNLRSNPAPNSWQLPPAYHQKLPFVPKPPCLSSATSTTEHRRATTKSADWPFDRNRSLLSPPTAHKQYYHALSRFRTHTGARRATFGLRPPNILGSGVQSGWSTGTGASAHRYDLYQDHQTAASDRPSPSRLDSLFSLHSSNFGVFSAPPMSPASAFAGLSAAVGIDDNDELENDDDDDDEEDEDCLSESDIFSSDGGSSAPYQPRKSLPVPAVVTGREELPITSFRDALNNTSAAKRKKRTRKRGRRGGRKHGGARKRDLAAAVAAAADAHVDESNSAVLFAALSAALEIPN